MKGLRAPIDIDVDVDVQVDVDIDSSFLAASKGFQSQFMYW